MGTAMVWPDLSMSRTCPSLLFNGLSLKFSARNLLKLQIISSTTECQKSSVKCLEIMKQVRENEGTVNEVREKNQMSFETKGNESQLRYL